MSLQTSARLCLLAAIIAAVRMVAPAQDVRGQEPSRKQVNEGGISFVYDVRDFGELRVTREEKATGNEVESSFPVDVPAHNCFRLEDKRPLPALDKGPRYFHPARSFVCFIPLRDSSVADYDKTYPHVSRTARDLRGLLRGRANPPFGNSWWRVWRGKFIPDLPFNNAGPSVIAKSARLSTRTLVGVAFLTQYTQEMQPNPVNNEELTYNFQGLTRDGRYYVAARFAVTHPSLPKGIDFASVERDKRLLYLRGDERKLSRLPESSFRPSLKSLKALLSSVEIK